MMKTADTNFSKLLAKIKTDIAALVDEDSEALFVKVGTFIHTIKAQKTPACTVWPVNDPDNPDDINNVGAISRYRFGVGFAFKDSKKDSELIDKALYCREKVKTFFEGRPDYTAIVTGYMQTLIENRELTLDEFAPEGVLQFGSGLVVIVEVQRDY